MKQLYASLIGIFLCYCSVYAQIPSCNAPVPYNKLAYDMLKNLDKSQIPTGVLYESVYPWAEIEGYEGSTTADTSSFPHFIESYSEIYNSTFNKSALVHVSDFETTIKNFHSDIDFHHPVGIIDYNYNTIDPNAVVNNLMYVSNNQLFDTPSRSSSPYINKTAFIVAPLLADGITTLYGGTHYFHFSNDFVLTNRGFDLNAVQNVEVQIDGVTVYNQSVSGLNNAVIPVPINPTIVPKKGIIITIIFTIFQIQTIVKIGKSIFTKEDKFVPTPCKGTDQVIVTVNAIGSQYGRNSYPAKGVGTIFYANGNCAEKKLTKPIIFVDGFDPTNSQHAGEIWQNYLNAEFQENGTLTKLGDELLANGYDVIIFDQGSDGPNKGGGGLIENNALTLVQLLQTLYSQHSSTLQSDFVVVGASMGGLVSRYALTYMEHYNIPHHTKLFISFDSPQNGAQIPVGVQQFVDIATQYGALRKIEKVRYSVHNSDAAKQMLVHHSSSESETIEAHPFRSIFLSNLANLGNWPTQCRMVSIIDGNRVGKLKSTPQPDNGGKSVPSISSCETEIDFGIKRRLLPNCTQNYCYKTHTQTYLQTEATRCKSMDFTVNNESNLLKLIFGGGQFTTKSYYTQNANSTSYDLAPGARFGANPLDAINAWINAYSFAITGKLKISKNIVQYNNFIPTVSSVAYTFPNDESFSIYKNFTGINLSKCAGTTPFDTVYAPISDLDHVQINKEIANWFRSEIYYPKSSSICVNNDCPPYLTLNTPVPVGERLLKKAQNAIFIEQGFKADGINESVVFKATIGCNQVLSPQKSPKGGSTPSITTNCSQDVFTWDAPQVQCVGNGQTTFVASVKNMDVNTYAEFSTNGVNFSRANIFDDRWTITLPNQGGSQIFFARSADNRNYVIQGFLAYCTN